MCKNFYILLLMIAIGYYHGCSKLNVLNRAEQVTREKKRSNFLAFFEYRSKVTAVATLKK